MSLRYFLERFVPQGDLGDSELSYKFIDRHHLVKLKVDCCHELGPHDTVEHLVEVDEAIVNIDTHFQDNSVQIFIFRVVAEANTRSHTSR